MRQIINKIAGEKIQVLNEDFKRSIFVYLSYFYISALFFPLVLGGVVSSIAEKSYFTGLFFSPFILVWFLAFCFGIVNTVILIKAIRIKLNMTYIWPFLLGHVLANRALSIRELIYSDIFVTVAILCSLTSLLNRH